MKRLPVVLVVIALVAVALWNGVVRSAPEPGLYHGVVEAEQAQMAFEIGGRIATLSVHEGEMVTAGQDLAQLEEEELQAGLNAARAREAALKAQLEVLQEGSRPEEIAGARARVSQAQAELDRLRNGATEEQLRQSESRTEAARERWLQVEHGPRQEDLDAARASLRGSSSDLETARKEYERYQNLFKNGAVPAQVLDSYKNRLESARSRQRVDSERVKELEAGSRVEELGAARAEYQASVASLDEVRKGPREELVQAAASELQARESQLQLAVAGPRPKEIEAAERRWEEAKAATEAARTRLAKARLKSPVHGLVLRRNLEPGEMASPGVPVFTILEIDKPWVEIFVPETEIGQVTVGDRFQITVDSLPDKEFEGRVTRVYEQAEFTPKQIQTERERVNLVYRVKVEFDNPEGLLKPGMPADARKMNS